MENLGNHPKVLTEGQVISYVSPHPASLIESEMTTVEVSWLKAKNEVTLKLQENN